MLLSKRKKNYILKLNRNEFRYKFLVFVYRRAVSRLIVESSRTQSMMDSRVASPSGHGVTCSNLVGLAHTVLLPEVPRLDLLCRPGSFSLFQTQQFRKAASALRHFSLDLTTLSNCRSCLPGGLYVTLRRLSKRVLRYKVLKGQTVASVSGWSWEGELWALMWQAQ